jgi:hypothetical protein
MTNTLALQSSRVLLIVLLIAVGRCCEAAPPEPECLESIVTGRWENGIAHRFIDIQHWGWKGQLMVSGYEQDGAGVKAFLGPNAPASCDGKALRISDPSSTSDVLATYDPLSDRILLGKDYYTRNKQKSAHLQAMDQWEAAFVAAARAAIRDGEKDVSIISKIATAKTQSEELKLRQSDPEGIKPYAFENWKRSIIEEWCLKKPPD